MRTIAAWPNDTTSQAAIAATPWIPGNKEFLTASGLTLAKNTVQVIFPGAAHSDDNMVVYFPEQKILFGGCMVRASNTLGNIKDANLVTWPVALQHLLQYKLEYVVPGHGESFKPELVRDTLALFAREPVKTRGY